MSGKPLAPPPPRALLGADGKISDRFYQWLGSVQQGISGAFSSIGSVQAQQYTIDFPIESPDNKDYLFELSALSGYTINKVMTQCISGSCTVTTKIGGTALGGGANAASTTLQTKTHTTSNVVEVGDSSVITISANSSCAGLMVQYVVTPT